MTDFELLGRDFLGGLLQGGMALPRSSTLMYCSVTQLCPTLRDPINCSMPGRSSVSFPISHNLLKLMSIESVMPSNQLILCCPFLLLFSIFLRTRIFFNELTLRHHVAKVNVYVQWIFILFFLSARHYGATLLNPMPLNNLLTQVLFSYLSRVAC